LTAPADSDLTLLAAAAGEAALMLDAGRVDSSLLSPALACEERPWHVKTVRLAALQALTFVQASRRGALGADRIGETIDRAIRRTNDELTLHQPIEEWRGHVTHTLAVAFEGAAREAIIAGEDASKSLGASRALRAELLVHTTRLVQQAAGAPSTPALTVLARLDWSDQQLRWLVTTPSSRLMGLDLGRVARDMDDSSNLDPALAATAQLRRIAETIRPWLRVAPITVT
jgi:hypothetical protein